MFTKIQKKQFQSQRLFCRFATLAAACLLTSTISAQVVLDTVQHHELDEQVIRYQAPAVQTTFNMNSIGPKQIKAQLGNGSVNNLLELMPSMITTSDAGTGVGYTYMRIRGIDQTRINVTLNGVTLNDQESQGSWLVNLPDLGSNIEQINVQRGGNAAAGAVSYGAHIDFVTKSVSDKAFAEVSSAYGSFNTFHNTISAGTGLLGKRFSALASFSDIRSDGYMDRASAKLNSAFFTAEYRMLDFKRNKDYGTLKFNLLYGHELTGLAWNGTSPDSLETHRTYNSCGEYYTDNGERKYYANETDQYTQSHYQLSYVKGFHNSDYSWNGKLNVAAHLTRGIGYYEQYKDDKKPSKYGLTAAEGFSKSDFITRKWLDNYYYGIHADYSDIHILKTNKSQDITWTIGGDADNYNGKHYGDVIWAQPEHVLDFPVDYRWYNGTGDKFQSKLFASLQYRIERFLVFAELQYRMINYKLAGTDDNMMAIPQKYNWNFVNPKLFLQYNLGKKKDQYLFLSFSMANREPTRSDLLDGPLVLDDNYEPVIGEDGYIITDNKPVPETVYDFEFGYNLAKKKFRFDATLYAMYYTDQLVLTGELNDVGANIMANVDKSYRAGIELSVAYQPVKFFTWHINGCFSRNRIIDYVNFVDDWDAGEQREEHLGNTPIAFSPNVVLANDFTFTPLKNFDISLVSKFVSKQYLDNSGDNSNCLKPYSYTNLRLSYSFSLKCMKEIGVFFQVNNIFNAKYSSNAWIYSYYYENVKCADTGYFPQAGINFLGGLRLKF